MIELLVGLFGWSVHGDEQREGENKRKVSKKKKKRKKKDKEKRREIRVKNSRKE